MWLDSNCSFHPEQDYGPGFKLKPAGERNTTVLETTILIRGKISFIFERKIWARFPHSPILHYAYSSLFKENNSAEYF